MITIVTRNAPARLRGRLSLLLLEVASGVYAGNINSRTRKVLWDIVCSQIEDGFAVIIWKDSASIAGISFQTIGQNRRLPVILDGLMLVQFNPLETSDIPVDLIGPKKNN